MGRKAAEIKREETGTGWVCRHAVGWDWPRVIGHSEARTTTHHHVTGLQLILRRSNCTPCTHHHRNLSHSYSVVTQWTVFTSDYVTPSLDTRHEHGHPQSHGHQSGMLGSN
ncbi:hypothetical protein DPEC_G00339510 [Dallia pectoralis]|uniref:Uncharacterized protein n=1 Tax=Dallia pectoralis TaxID=75939 RepID=A0ACC2F5A8_DALPE|nr:hypothetical protein DPEC_G00339510 [Dallia pectoralis]